MNKDEPRVSHPACLQEKLWDIVEGLNHMSTKLPAARVVPPLAKRGAVNLSKCWGFIKGKEDFPGRAVLSMLIGSPGTEDTHSFIQKHLIMCHVPSSVLDIGYKRTQTQSSLFSQEAD